MAKVSVVIPFYAHAEWLEEAVESVLAQTFWDYEIIVVNDGSKEEMGPFLERYGRDIIYEYKENGGPSSARNRGMELATGTYVAFLDSDDRWRPDKLKIQVEQMELNHADWSYCGYRTFGDGSPVSYRMIEGEKPQIQRYHCPYIATPCVMIRRQILEEHPECRFHTSLRYGQDSLFWLMINADYPILAIPEELTEVRMRGSNASKRARVQLEARGSVWRCRKEQKERLIAPFHVSLLYRAASELCVAGTGMIRFLEKKISSPKMIEMLSKMLFVLPWAMFKAERWGKGREKENA